MMYGEFLAGVVKNEKNILFININWGLGAGIIIDGNLIMENLVFQVRLGMFVHLITKLSVIAEKGMSGN